MMKLRVSDITTVLLCHSIDVLLRLSLIHFTFADEICKGVPDSTCRCKTESGHVLDLSPLVNTTAYPLFYNVTATSDHALYSYKPCGPMTVPVGDMNSPCHNVAVCQVSHDGIVNIGNFDPVHFMYETETKSLYIQYTAGNKTTKVYLVCSTVEKSLTVKGETATNSTIYDMTLHTKYACLSKDGSPKIGLSVGSILLILFFVGVLIYMVGGIVLLRCVRGARGFEQIPNYDFWLDFPVLVKDGVMFVTRGCKAESDRTYDQI
ncbi:hypothetical protein LSH36_439g01031 [Paralvinella palmiformis]|uniref:MRH domain-containing protein n=1 Tax=Paralvinella palmiformis TaxID=53620 RepID=A0AAD9JBE1_9ANNE|nr:hypothetical protein LSH36_439g01031 [Paralvinella palmiformis]